MPPSESIEAAIRPLLLAALAVDALIALVLVAMFRHRLRFRRPRFDQPLWPVTILTLAAAAMRIPFLTRPLGTDEAATFLYYASKPLSIGLTIYGSPNNHLLNTLLMHASWRLFGAHEWALRLPAFLFGVALVPLTVMAARAVVRDGALVAAAFVAAAPVFVDYSTDGRGYTMLCAFALLALLTTGFAFAVSVALGAYAVPAMLYPFAMLVAWRPRKLLAGAGLAVLFTLMLYLPTLLVSGMGAITSNAYVRPLPFAQFAAAVPHALGSVWRSWMTAIPLPLQMALAIAFVAGAIRRRATLWLGLLAPLAIVAAQRTIPFARVWLPFAVLFAITAAAALPWGRWEMAAAAALFVLLALGAFTPRLRETGELPYVREMARDLAARAAPADAIAAAPPSDVPLAFYLDARVLRPDLAHARRIFVVVNRAYGQSLPRTLEALDLDARAFAIRPARDFGASAIYELDRR